MVLTRVLWALQPDAVWTKSQYSNGLGNGFPQSFPRFTHKVDLDALVDELSNPDVEAIMPTMRLGIFHRGRALWKGTGV